MFVLDIVLHGTLNSFSCRLQLLSGVSAARMPASHALKSVVQKDNVQVIARDDALPTYV